MAMALGGLIKGLLNVEGMDMNIVGDDVVYTVEVDSVFERMAPLKAKIATLLDLPLKWGHIEEITEVTRGLVVKAYKVKIAIPRSEIAHRETRIRKVLGR